MNCFNRSVINNYSANSTLIYYYFFYSLLQYYEAVVEMVVPNLSSCVVTFVEYGNMETVYLSDVQPLSVPQMVSHLTL